MCTNCSPRSSLDHIALIKFGESIFLIFHDQTLLEVALAQAQATSGSVVQLRLVQLRLVQLGFVQPSLVQPRLVQLRLVQLRLVQLGLI